MSYIQNIELMTSKSTKYIHSAHLDASTSIVTITEPYDTILYIINLTTDDVIYNPLHKGRGGYANGSYVELNYPMTGMSDTDRILVAVSYEEQTSIETNINELLDEVKISNKYNEVITGDKITNQDI